ncbi:peptide chain release factor N(5)-glutamine methyltransferase [Candidatus Parcubacteria bacterium]|nr:peptide chain release factor N(5)-glutamine methyltransferase [Candidatus Parcubacteria bacterium]
MTINQALIAATQKLQKNKISSPNMDAEILLLHILKKPREYLFTYPEKKLTKIQIINYKLQINRRIKGEPIAYITRHKEFYGLDFFVNKNVLVPRPETELMVEEVLEHVTHNTQHTTIIDIGTGSGCVIISLAKLLKFEIRNQPARGWSASGGKSKIRYLAADISSKALYVAKKNAKFHGVNKNIKFLCGNLLEPILNNLKHLNNPKNLTIITANLPYGWNSWKNNCSMDTIGLKFEPPIALFTENRGLKIIENFLKQIKQIINSQKINFNSNLLLLIEFDPRQTIMLKKLIKKILPNAKFQIKKDLRGYDRLARISI